MEARNKTMRSIDETTPVAAAMTSRNTANYDTYAGEEFSGFLDHGNNYSGTPASKKKSRRRRLAKGDISLSYFQNMSPSLLPGDVEDDGGSDHELVPGRKTKKKIIEYQVLGATITAGAAAAAATPTPFRTQQRGFRRRLFLFLTEPSSSWSSAIFFFVLILAICISNLIIVLETMTAFRYRPTECDFCGDGGGFFDNTDDDGNGVAVKCECPMRPQPCLETLLGIMMRFFAFEWTLRVLSYVPAHRRPDLPGKFRDWLGFLSSTTTIFDALAIWPYFIETCDLPGLVSLRLLRILRVFQLLRLGSYNSMFVSLTTVLYKSIGFLKLLLAILFFGATIFGSLLFW